MSNERVNVALTNDDPRMIAWKKYTATENYADARKQALALNHDDGRPVSEQYRESVVEGAIWAAFITGFEMGINEYE